MEFLLFGFQVVVSCHNHLCLKKKIYPEFSVFLILRSLTNLQTLGAIGKGHCKDRKVTLGPALLPT